ncbi:MAG: LysR family transcriptional regulator [Betaproteobacteria bacterium]|nr:LysR family transcriptional regulator [Betaproteobacteria bacterium]
MDLRQLRYFVAVAEELNFSRAARKVHISQPPLSRQVALLEQQLDVKLLHRTTHEVSLTKAGEAFLAEARQLLALSAKAGDVARRASRGEIGRVRVGFIGAALYSFLPKLLREYRQRYPDVEISITQLTIAQQVEALRSREIDVGVIRQHIVDAALQTWCVLKEPFIVALPLDHPLARRDKVMLRSLAQEPFVFFNRVDAPVVYDQTLRICERAGFSPHIVQEARPMATVIGLVAAGMGVSIVPTSMQRINIEHVAYRPLGGTRAVNEFVVAWHRDHRSPVLSRFLEMAKER